MRNEKNTLIKQLTSFPYFLRNRITQSPDLQKALNNTKWLVIEKLLRMVIGLIVGVWVARYLGPVQYGLMNYALAFVAIFSGIASFGLNGIVVRDVIKKDKSVGETLGTAFILQVFGGLLTLSFIAIVIRYIRPGETLILNMVLVLGFVFIFKSTEVIKYWFESLVQSRYSVFVEGSAYLISSVIKIALIVIKAPLMAFVWALFIEGLITAAGLFIVYTYKGWRINAWQVSCKRVLSLLKDSWPLLVSGTLVLINMSIDKVMLGQLANDQEVGFYSAANVFVGFWYFIPMVIIGSIAPKLIKMHTLDLYKYDDLSKKIYLFLGGGSFIVALIFSFASDALVLFLYGDQFKSAGSVLAISIWSIVFIFQVSFRGRLLVIENEQIYVTILILMGTLTNIFLNFLLIPICGAIGSAIAFTASWGFSALIFPMIFKKTRHHAMWSLGLNCDANSNTRRN